jgi:acyl-CoA thioesterase-1
MKTGSPSRPAVIPDPSSVARFSALHGLVLLFACLVGVTGHLGAAEAAPVVSAAAEETPTIVFFGDSLTAGYGLANPGRESYPALIQEKLTAAGLNYRVVNAGLSGDTSAGGLSRIDWTMRQPIDVFVLALGANDGLRGTAPAVTARNLQAIIDRVRAKYPKVRIVVAGMMMPDNMGPEFTKAFRELFPALADKNKAALVPFLLEGVGGKRELNQVDGIHPRPEGHAILADNVWKVLRPLL